MSESLAVTEALGAAGAIAPRVKLEDIKAAIVEQHTFTAGQALSAMGNPSSEATSMLTICLLVMRNGFVIVGKSAPASPENFDAEKGKTFAYEDAMRQVWPLMGYALRDKLSGL